MQGERAQLMWTVLLVLVSSSSWVTGMCPARCQCNDSVLQVACVSAALEVVPIQLNPEVQHIDLSNNKISNLHYTFSFYSHLVTLDLSANKIHNLGFGNFDSQHHLKFLNLSTNEIETLSKDTLKGLRSLYELDLSFNRLEELSIHAFRDLHSLQILWLKSNLLVSLKEGLLKPAKMLKELYLDNNQLIDVPGPAIADAVVLQKLILSGNLIESIREETVPLLPELKVLFLNKNVVNDIEPGALSDLPALMYLDLSDNNFTIVPTASLSKLANLIELRFSGNFINTIPPVAFRGLFHLNCLHLDRLEMLTKIDYRAFVDNINLERVRLDDNIVLDALPTRLFHGNPKVTHISIRNNQLEKIDDTHFPLDQLKVLKLGGNPWKCNCSLLWLWRLGQEQLKIKVNDSEPSRLVIDMENVICYGPQEVANTALVEVKESAIDCSQDWKTAVSAIIFVSIVLTAAALIMYYGHVKSKKRRKKNARSRESVQCPNNTNLGISLPYEDPHSGKCISGVGNVIIHEYETLPPWNPYTKQSGNNFGHFNANVNIKPHIVYV